MGLFEDSRYYCEQLTGYSFQFYNKAGIIIVEYLYRSIFLIFQLFFSVKFIGKVSLEYLDEYLKSGKYKKIKV